MALKVGIVGLPNAGKSSLFNCLSKQKVETANYNFTTIKPNIGEIEVPDPRLDFLCSKFNSKKKTYKRIIFYDIAGLVKGASQGIGLGNAFLSHIKEVNIICLLVRSFLNEHILHVEKQVNPVRDIKLLQAELIKSDLNQIEKKIFKLKKKVKSLSLPQAENSDEYQDYTLALKAKAFLQKNLLLYQISFSPKEFKHLLKFNLLTTKKIFICANYGEEEIQDFKQNFFYSELKQFCFKNSFDLFWICVSFELLLSSVDEETKNHFLDEYHVKKSKLPCFIERTYNFLGWQTFYTAGLEETRAWSFPEKSLIPDCGKIIHTDFKKYFIKAEVYSFDDFKKNPSITTLKKLGLIRKEGKNYLTQDGDVCFFIFNKTNNRNKQ